jgi:mono/diheme cytochrome c family protein
LGDPVVINETAAPPVPTLNPEWVTQGMVVYARECATCHGANLEGAPDWKESLPDGSLPPPPHDISGHTWHHPDSLLLAIIAEGGDPAFNSKMPAFRDKLTELERRAVLEFIKSTWGRNEAEFQWWMTAPESGA